MPQIILLNHAAWVNGKRLDARTAKPSQEDEPVFGGKKLDEMDSDDLTNYYSTWM
jgi:hypothetical protein